MQRRKRAGDNVPLSRTSQSPFRRDAETNTRDACATRNGSNRAYFNYYTRADVNPARWQTPGSLIVWVPMIALKDSLGTEFVERVRTIFSETGRLSKSKNFEFRPQQQEMAVAVARTLEEERHLVVEAGTGVGKSLAYLVPAILFALEQKKKAIVSTHTINLQEQLLHKDIPILKKVLPVEFEAALMKGRQNYLCPRRLERALQSEQELFTGHERSELQRLAEWARTTRDGSISDLSIELDPKVWAQLCSEAHVCTQKTSGQDPRCFYQQARKRLLAADLIVLNHTLLFVL